MQTANLACHVMARWRVSDKMLSMSHTMHTSLIKTLLTMGVTMGSAFAAEQSTHTDWLRDARIGAFMHFLPDPGNGAALVEAFDVDALADQLESIGARYFIFTLGQNSGWINSPNAAYNQVTGFKPGERCATRDLPADLHEALSAKGIRLMLYLPCQTPNRDARAQKAFGLAEGPRDQPIDLDFAKQWAEVIREWSERYGEKVSGWWFDGGYERRVRFNDDTAQIYADAAKSGNAKAIVTFNPGLKFVRHTKAEDYTAGEVITPFALIPESRWVNGSQWHVLTFLGKGWKRRDTRYPTERWQEWFKEVVANGGAVTFDMGPNMNPELGPIGTLGKEQADQFRRIAQQVEGPPSPARPSEKANKPDAGDGK